MKLQNQDGGVPVRRRLALTSAQSGIFHHQCRNEGNPFYNVGGYIRLENCDIDRLRRAHARLVESFEVFRIRIAVDDDGVYQTYAPAANAELAFVDLSARSDPQAAAQAWLDELFSSCLPIENGELHRAALLKLSDNLHFYVGLGHHIALDGIGFVNWGSALARFYADPSGDWLSHHPEVSHAELVERDRTYRDGDRYDKDLRFWTQKAQGFNDSLFSGAHGGVLPGAHARSARESLPLTPHLRAKLEALSAALGVERHQLVLAVLSIYFTQSYRSDSVVVGVPLHGRQTEAERNKIGLLTQMLPMLVQVDAAAPASGALAAIRQAQRELMRHRLFPVMEVANHPHNPRPKDGLFDFAFSYLPVGEHLDFDGIPGRLVYCSHGHEQVPLLVTYWDAQGDEGSALLFDYNLGHFPAAEITAAIQRCLHLIDQLAEDAHRPVSELDCVTPEERQQLLSMAEGEDGRTVARFDVAAQLASQFAAHPDQAALEGDFGIVRYAELGRRVDAVAASLRDAHGIVKGDRVAVLLPHSSELIVALLALIRLGAVYVPIDPQSPVLRTRHILADSGVRLVLTGYGREPAPEESASVARWANLDSLESAATAGNSPQAVPIDADDPLYVLYTSGSTGVPKGVLITRAAAENLLGGFVHRVRPGTGTRWLFMSSVAFDISIVEWLCCLALGNTCVLPSPEQLADPFALAAMANTMAPGFVQATPSRLKLLCSAGWRPHDGQCVVSAGEPLPAELAEHLLACGVALWNGYGPTEATVYSLIKRVRGDEHARSRTAIGGQLPGYRHYVLNKHGGLVPPGLPGELAIAGAGLAVGYVNLPEQTRRRFVPGGRLPEARLYLTGDVVRRLDGHNFEYLGRSDDQIKLRGYRIELDEIRSAILQSSRVRDVAVVHRKAEHDRPARLIAYVCLDSADDDALAQLRGEVARALPEYMLPSAFVVLDALPVNTNGKLDKSRLPAPEDGQSEEPLPLASVRERQVAAVWSEMLGLPVSALGRHSDFFALGGDSVLAVRMAGRLRSSTARKVDVGDIFRYPRLTEFAVRIDALPPWPEPAGIPVLSNASDATAHRDQPSHQSGSHPLSYEQQRIWFIDQMEQGSRHYNMPVALQLQGRIVPEFIETAFRRIVARHESLRTVFAVDASDQPVQVVRDAASLRLVSLPLAGDDRDAAVRRLRDEEQNTPFDLKRDLMLRVRLLRVTDEEAVLFLTLHHIAADGWSVDRMIEEFGDIYTGLLEGEARELPPLTLQYKDYAARQRAWAGTDDASDGVAFWRQRLDGAPQCHSLPLDFARGEAQSLRGRTITTRIPGELAGRLKALGREQGATLFVVLQTTFALMVARWSEHRDVLIGSPVANRHCPETMAMIGFFVNTLVLRTDCRENLHFSELLRRSRSDFIDAFEHQRIPFDVLVDTLTQVRNPAHPPLVQILFSLQDDTSRRLSRLKLPGLEFRLLDEDIERPAKFDLELMISECDDGLVCQWLFDTGLFAEDTIRRMSDAFLRLLQAVSADADQRIHDIDIVDGAEREALMAPPRALPPGVAEGGLICERFERTAQRHGDAAAVIHGDRQLSYEALLDRSTRLADWMIANGYGNGRPVAIYMRRGIALVVAIMAVMRTGSPYLPVDQSYPAQRVDYILRDSGAALLLCDRESLDRLGGQVSGLTVRTMDDVGSLDDDGDDSDVAAIAALTVEKHRPSGKNHAYVVYTSGSTGQPKGVMVRQESFLNLVLWYLHDYGFSSDDRCLLIGSIGFDMTQKNLFTPLLAGGTLVIPDEYFDPGAIARLIAEQQVTVINCVPSAAYQLIESQTRWPALSSLRLLALGGEAIRLNPLRPWLRSEHCRARLLNMYGPSECTDIAIAADYGKDEAAACAYTLPIGRPIYNCTAYVLNERMKLQPRGVIGELFLGGVGVSDGYVNLDALTRTSFLDDALPGAGRIYRTGDLARIDRDGVFHYMGRADQQVKIRGYRVETAEIDAIIASCPNVKQATTLEREDANGEHSLVSFLVLDGDDAGADFVDDVFTRVRKVLIDTLPGYMVPARFVRLDAMPLTPNGKVDRRELANRASTATAWRYARQLRAPTDETQARLLELWRELLGVEEIGTDDNFFELGGHSLLATRLTSRVHKDFGLDDASLSIKEFFHHPTIEATARLIDAKRRYGMLIAKEKAMLESSAGIEEGSF